LKIHHGEHDNWATKAQEFEISNSKFITENTIIGQDDDNNNDRIDDDMI